MMEEKMLPVPNEGHRRRQKQRRRRFPWGSIAAVILVVAVCVYAFTLFGDKESPENSQGNDTTTQGPYDVQVGLWMKAHSKTRSQQMMTPTGTWCW